MRTDRWIVLTAHDGIRRVAIRGDQIVAIAEERDPTIAACTVALASGQTYRVMENLAELRRLVAETTYESITWLEIEGSRVRVAAA